MDIRRLRAAATTLAAASLLVLAAGCGSSGDDPGETSGNDPADTTDTTVEADPGTSAGDDAGTALDVDVRVANVATLPDGTGTPIEVWSQASRDFGRLLATVPYGESAVVHPEVGEHPAEVHSGSATGASWALGYAMAGAGEDATMLEQRADGYPGDRLTTVIAVTTNLDDEVTPTSMTMYEELGVERSGYSAGFPAEAAPPGTRLLRTLSLGLVAPEDDEGTYDLGGPGGCYDEVGPPNSDPPSGDNFRSRLGAGTTQSWAYAVPTADQQLTLATVPDESSGPDPDCSHAIATFEVPADLGDHGYLLVYGPTTDAKALILDATA